MLNTSPPFWAGSTVAILPPNYTLVDFEAAHPFVSWSGGALVNQFMSLPPGFGDWWYRVSGASPQATFTIANPSTNAFNKMRAWINGSQNITMYGNMGTTRTFNLVTGGAWIQTTILELNGAPDEYITSVVTARPGGGNIAIDNLELSTI